MESLVRDRSPELSSQRRCILAYHEILPKPSSYAYRVSTSQFGEHLEMFASERNCVTSAKLPRCLPEITFDDGHCSNALHALPMLEKTNQKATFFVLAGRIGQSSDTLSWEQARTLIASGQDVQSHGWSHRLLTQCSPKDLERELVYSKKKLEDHLGREVTAITAPGGRWDLRVLLACGRAGYHRLYHSNPWIPAGTVNGVEFRGRLMVTSAMNAHDLAHMMRLNRTQRLFMRAKFALKDAARSTIGDRMYHQLWCALSNYDASEGIEIVVAAHPLFDRSLEPK